MIIFNTWQKPEKGLKMENKEIKKLLDSYYLSAIADFCPFDCIGEATPVKKKFKDIEFFKFAFFSEYWNLLSDLCKEHNLKELSDAIIAVEESIVVDYVIPEGHVDYCHLRDTSMYGENKEFQALATLLEVLDLDGELAAKVIINENISGFEKYRLIAYTILDFKGYFNPNDIVEKLNSIGLICDDLLVTVEDRMIAFSECGLLNRTQTCYYNYKDDSI